jgi:hypothetical protein
MKISVSHKVGCPDRGASARRHLYTSQEALKMNTANCARLPQRTAMSRTLVWVEQQHFLGFGCSECGWRFEPSGAPTGTSFHEMMHNFELQRDRQFSFHVCADHSKEARYTLARRSDQT